MNVPVSEAKAKFAELLRRVEAGEEIVLTRNGKPVADLGPHKPEQGRLPRLGALKGRTLYIAEDFDELGPEWDEYLG